MNLQELFINPTVIGGIVGTVSAFLVGIIVTYIFQSITERKKKCYLTYSKEKEEPLVILQEELTEHLQIRYQGEKVKNIYFFRLRIANTGQKTIKRQIFTCLFSEGARIIDSNFPKIRMEPEIEVGPVEMDDNVTRENEFRFSIDTLGKGQIVNIEFLTVDNESSKFDIGFRPNESDEVEFIEGDIFKVPDLEKNLSNFMISILLLYIGMNVLSFPLTKFGVPIALLFIALFLKYFVSSFSSLISIIARKIEQKNPENFLFEQTENTIGGHNISVMGHARVKISNKMDERTEHQLLVQNVNEENNGVE